MFMIMVNRSAANASFTVPKINLSLDDDLKESSFF